MFVGMREDPLHPDPCMDLPSKCPAALGHTGATNPSFAHGPFLLVRRALGTLVAGGAEPTENALCLRPASSGPPKLPPRVAQGPAVPLAPGLTQQPLPPAAPLLGFDMSWPWPAQPGDFAAPSLQPAPPPASTTPATSQHSRAAFLALSRCSGLDCTVPTLGTNFRSSLVLPPLQ